MTWIFTVQKCECGRSHSCASNSSNCEGFESIRKRNPTASVVDRELPRFAALHLNRPELMWGRQCRKRNLPFCILNRSSRYTHRRKLEDLPERFGTCV